MYGFVAITIHIYKKRLQARFGPQAIVCQHLIQSGGNFLGRRQVVYPILILPLLAQLKTKQNLDFLGQLHNQVQLILTNDVEVHLQKILENVLKREQADKAPLPSLHPTASNSDTMKGTTGVLTNHEGNFIMEIIFRDLEGKEGA